MVEGGRCLSKSATILSFGRKLKFSQLPYNINDKVHGNVIGGVDPTEYIVADYWINKDGRCMFKIPVERSNLSTA